MASYTASSQKAHEWLVSTGVLHAYRAFLERTYMRGLESLEGYSELYAAAADEMLTYRDNMERGSRCPSSISLYSSNETPEPGEVKEYYPKGSPKRKQRDENRRAKKEAALMEAEEQEAMKLEMEAREKLRLEQEEQERQLAEEQADDGGENEPQEKAEENAAETPAGVDDGETAEEEATPEAAPEAAPEADADVDPYEGKLDESEAADNVVPATAADEEVEGGAGDDAADNAGDGDDNAEEERGGGEEEDVVEELGDADEGEAAPENMDDGGEDPYPEETGE